MSTRLLIVICLFIVASIISCGQNKTPILPTSDAGKPWGGGVLYITTMTHMERYKENETAWADHLERSVFNKHAEQLRSLARLFENHGAKMTIESAWQFAYANIVWNDNVLRELRNRGHGIGLHADRGLDVQTHSAGVDYEGFVTQLKSDKEYVENVVGPIVHVSGTGTPLDWVRASVEAGFKAANGATTYYLLSIPEANRPVGWPDARIWREFHETVPFDVAHRVHPWRTSSGENWLTHDPNGKLVYIPGESGMALEDAAEGYLYGPDSGTKVLTLEDIDTAMKAIDNALVYATPDKINVWYIGLTAKLGDFESHPEYRHLLDNWLARIDAYVAAGKVQWKTVPEMYDAYIQWEQGQ